MWKFGHRGACGYAPENTMASMYKAMELAVDGFEFDIQLSKDGVPIVIHDNTLERTTNGTGKVSDFTLKELQELDAGNGEKIPSLEEVVNLFGKKTKLFIELKAEDSVKPVLEVLKNSVENSGFSYEQFFICSFNHFHITEVIKKIPAIRCCALFVGIPVTLAQIAKDAGAWAISTAIHHTNRKLVLDAHDKGLKSMLWTANTKEEIALAHSLKADGIFSNYPDRI